ncbi:MAG: hypothetical protein GY866_32850 [Proteobacteria bacterium]|nr:hypothetical protein [Pseudomonadota bacterium]
MGGWMNRLRELRRGKMYGWIVEKFQIALIPVSLHVIFIEAEFKYTESVNKDALLQTLIYENLYKKSNKLKPNEARIFLISSKTPRKSTLEKFGFCATDKKGVYSSVNIMLDSITLISLNELANSPYNSYFKLFASRKKEKRTAFNTFKRMPRGHLSIGLRRFLAGLYNLWFTLGGDEMQTELTPEHVEEMGKLFGEQFLSSLPPEERVKGLKPHERVKGLKPEEIFSMFKLEEIFSRFKPEEIQAYLDRLKKNK